MHTFKVISAFTGASVSIVQSSFEGNSLLVESGFDAAILEADAVDSDSNTEGRLEGCTFTHPKLCRCFWRTIEGLQKQQEQYSTVILKLPVCVCTKR
jgi:hypothetical protein